MNFNRLVKIIFAILLLVTFGEVGYYVYYQYGEKGHLRTKPIEVITSTISPQKITVASADEAKKTVTSEHTEFINSVLEKIKENKGSAFLTFEGKGFLKDVKYLDDQYYSYKIYNEKDAKIIGQIVKKDSSNVIFYNIDKKVISPEEIKGEERKVDFIFKYNVFTKTIDKVEIFLEGQNR